MLFRFQIGRRQGQRVSAAWIRVYYMPHWRIVRSGARYVVYRPSERTLVHLLGISVLALVIAALLAITVGFPWSPADPPQEDAGAARQIRIAQQATEELRKKLSPEVKKALERRAAEQAAELEVERQQLRRRIQISTSARNIAYWGVFCGLMGVALVPASYPFARILIGRTSKGTLVIRKRGLWPTRRRWPPETFGQITYGAEPERRGRRARRSGVPWLWIVKLQASPEVLIRDEGTSLPAEVQFVIDRQPDRPADGASPPESVRKLVLALRRVVGISMVGRTIEEDDTGPGLRQVTRSISTEPLSTHTEVMSLDQVPEHLRPQVERLLEEGRTGEFLLDESFHITVRDADGTERVYTSPEELPPEMRWMYSEWLSRRRRK